MTTGIQTPIPSLSAEDRAWLKALQSGSKTSLWRFTAPDCLGHRHCSERREMTRKEWTRIKRLIRRHTLPCEMHSGACGGLWISIYVPPPTFGVPAEFVLSVGQESLPGLTTFAGSETDCAREAWKALSPFTHSDRNKELLEIYALEPSREQPRYEY